MTVARLGREMTSAEFTRWAEYYRIEDAAKAGKLEELEHRREAEREDQG